MNHPTPHTAKPYLMSALWEDYRAKVLPQDAGTNQVQECRLAFYAGAGSLLKTVIGIGSNDSFSTARKAEMIEFIDQELTTFYRTLEH